MVSARQHPCLPCHDKAYMKTRCQYRPDDKPLGFRANYLRDTLILVLFVQGTDHLLQTIGIGEEGASIAIKHSLTRVVKYQPQVICQDFPIHGAPLFDVVQRTVTHNAQLAETAYIRYYGQYHFSIAVEHQEPVQVIGLVEGLQHLAFRLVGIDLQC